VKRYTIDPANFTDGQWEEMVNATATLIPMRYEARHSAKPVKRPKKHIQLAIMAMRERADDVGERYDEASWVADLRAAADTLEALVGPRRWTKAEAKARLHGLLTSDIYTDAPEYAERVAEIHELLPLVFGKGR
jgi:hypothetical protein